MNKLPINTALACVRALDRAEIPYATEKGYPAAYLDHARFTAYMQDRLPGAIALLIALAGIPVVSKGLMRRYQLCNTGPDEPPYGSIEAFFEGRSVCALGSVLVQTPSSVAWPDAASVVAEFVEGEVNQSNSEDFRKLQLGMLTILKANDGCAVDLTIDQPWRPHYLAGAEIFRQHLQPIVRPEPLPTVALPTAPSL